MFAQPGTRHRRIVKGTIRLAITWSLLIAGPQAIGAGETALTFFGWSDQHVQVDGDASHLQAAIDAMNQLPGTPFPDQFGGVVQKPAFVFGCGDITEWPTRAAVKAYASLLTDRLKYPAYDVMGNHDEGGKAPSTTARDWLVGRHGALTYCFESHGVRFIALFSKYDESLDNPAQPLTQESLDELHKLLQQAPPDQPTIVATHLCFDAMTNRAALLDVLEPYHILAVLGGHYHKAKVDRDRGQLFIQLPSPAPGSPSEIMVFRITADRIVALPYDYERGAWSTDRGKFVNEARDVASAENKRDER
jgi:hypothetical protein